MLLIFHIKIGTATFQLMQPTLLAGGAYFVNKQCTLYFSEDFQL